MSGLGDRQLVQDRPDPAGQVEASPAGQDELLREIALLRTALGRCADRIAELDRLANVDSLVDLPNRRHFLDRLSASVSEVDRRDGEAAVIFLDVDELKAINDEFGHEAGDAALVEISQLVVKSVRQGDFVARLSGDEFAILLPSSDELNAWRTALRIVETVENCSFAIDGRKVALSVAVGVAMIKPGDTCKAALSRADQEMYRIKALSGRA